MSDLKTVIEGLDLCLEGLCDICPYKNSNAPGGCKDELMYDAMILLKTQELPTNTSITSAIECLLHPQDADDSDMAKAIDTAVRAMRLLKEREPIRPGLGIIHHDDGSKSYFLHCPLDGTTLVDGDNYCRRCGRAVKWSD